MGLVTANRCIFSKHICYCKDTKWCEHGSSRSMSDCIPNPNVNGAFLTEQIGGFHLIRSNMLQIAPPHYKNSFNFLMELSLVTSTVFAYVLGWVWVFLRLFADPTLCVYQWAVCVRTHTTMRDTNHEQRRERAAKPAKIWEKFLLLENPLKCRPAW